MHFFKLKDNLCYRLLFSWKYYNLLNIFSPLRLCVCCRSPHGLIWPCLCSGLRKLAGLSVSQSYTVSLVGKICKTKFLQKFWLLLIVNCLGKKHTLKSLCLLPKSKHPVSDLRWAWHLYCLLADSVWAKTSSKLSSCSAIKLHSRFSLLFYWS